MSEQNFANHPKIVPTYHYFVLPVLGINFIQAIVRLVSVFRHDDFGWRAVVAAVINLLLAMALFVLAFRARVFALSVQDRIIRLEERLRYQQLLPEDLRPRIGEFTINQLVALRFASDAELPVLARKVLDGKINNRKAIKQMIQNWRPDYQRV